MPLPSLDFTPPLIGCFNDLIVTLPSQQKVKQKGLFPQFPMLLPLTPREAGAHLREDRGQPHLLAVVLAHFIPEQGHAYPKS